MRCLLHLLHVLLTAGVNITASAAVHPTLSDIRIHAVNTEAGGHVEHAFSTTAKRQTALRGTFVSLSQSVCNAAGNWHTELAAMAALRMDTIVTISSVDTEPAGNRSTAFYPSMLPFVTEWLEGKADCIGNLLHAAQARGGFHVHLGLELNRGFDEAFWHGSSNVTFFREAASHNMQIMGELQQLYGQRYAGTLVGVYDSNEINDVEMNYWATKVYYLPWVRHYLRPTHMHAVTLNLTSSNAPYFCHSGPNPAGWGPAAVAAFYRKMLDDIRPGMQRLWVQDCVGVSTGELYANLSGDWFRHPRDVLPFYAALAATMRGLDPPRLLWSDTEIFSNEIIAGHEVNYSAAPVERVLQQLNGEAAYVGGAVSFSWQYLSPSLGLVQSATKLHAEYATAIGAAVHDLAI